MWRLIQSFIAWCKDNYPKLSVNNIRETRLQYFKYGGYCKEALNSERVLDTHVQPDRTEDLYNQHSLCEWILELWPNLFNKSQCLFNKSQNISLSLVPSEWFCHIWSNSFEVGSMGFIHTYTYVPIDGHIKT